MLLFMSSYKTFQLMSYLKENYPHEWKYLNTYPIFGEGFANSIRILKFIKRTDTYNDPVLAKIKNEYLSFLKFMIMVLLSPILLIILNIFISDIPRP